MMTRHGLAALLMVASALSACERTRGIDAWLAEVESLGEPDFDAAQKGDSDYVADYRARQRVLYRQKARLLLELCRECPTDPRVPDWLTRRWELLGWNQEPSLVAQEILDDIESVLGEDLHPEAESRAAYWRAHYTVHGPVGDPEERISRVEAYVFAHPTDRRSPQLLSALAEDPSLSTSQRSSLYDRLSAEYPTTHAGTYAPGMRRRLQEVGEPFSLAFEDLRTGKAISMDGLEGQVVVIDFWATTCLPCIQELPDVQALYRDHHDQGLEVIGVSLDEPGFGERILEFTETRGVPWPQYYQGSGYDSEFSRSWGVGSAPTVFVIDKQGRLHSTDARRKLEHMIPSLLDD